MGEGLPWGAQSGVSLRPPAPVALLQDERAQEPRGLSPATGTRAPQVLRGHLRKVPELRGVHVAEHLGQKRPADFGVVRIGAVPAGGMLLTIPEHRYRQPRV